MYFSLFANTLFSLLFAPIVGLDIYLYIYWHSSISIMMGTFKLIPCFSTLCASYYFGMNSYIFHCVVLIFICFLFHCNRFLFLSFTLLATFILSVSSFHIVQGCLGKEMKVDGWISCTLSSRECVLWQFNNGVFINQGCVLNVQRMLKVLGNYCSLERATCDSNTMNLLSAH